jgi:molybdenum cofactor cytidylyltransferase
MIAGIVLAGGRSQRMGRPKALLKAGDETFLERAVRTLRAGGCDEVVVVVNDDDPDIARLVADAGARLALGEGPDTEQIDSLRAGLRALPENAAAAVVLPVDHPLVASETVRALVDAFGARGAPVVRPVHARGSRHGHPVLFSSTLFGELLDEELPEGARSVVHRHAGELEEIEVDDGGVVIDVDTPGRYDEYFGSRRGRKES